MDKPHIPMIEVAIVNACNLSCPGCTNYSDYAVSGMIRWAEAKEWFTKWNERVTFGTISLIGGEPLLHPELKDWLVGLREMFPNSLIQLTSNITLLERNPEVLDWLDSINGALLKVSKHQPDSDWFKRADNIIRSKYTWSQDPTNPDFLVNERYFRLTYQQDDTFIKTYKGELANMKPYNNPPEKAFWDMCCQQLCPLMVDGRLYKCSSIGLLRKVLTDWGHENDPDWQKYLAYTGVGLDCTDAELIKWVDNYGHPDWICSMCPAHGDDAAVQHIGNVMFKTERNIIPIKKQ